MVFELRTRHILAVDSHHNRIILLGKCRQRQERKEKGEKIIISSHHMHSFCIQCSMFQISSLLRTAVVGSLAGNRDIVGMTLEHTGIRNANELSMMQCLDGAGTTITHS